MTELYCAPGNGGIAQVAQCVPIKATDVEGMVQWAKDNAMDFVMDLDLTERVLCRPVEGSHGQVNLTHLDDLPPDHHHMAEHWKVMFEGQQIAEWSLPAAHPLHHG